MQTFENIQTHQKIPHIYQMLPRGTTWSPCSAASVHQSWEMLHAESGGKLTGLADTNPELVLAADWQECTLPETVPTHLLGISQA
mmetsp:Transcript_35519/g.79648  ORF Transcript_35519/g.79648 Transcript_35519/m.79648 type:complete len:85 (+) Transcript_35519:2181-2435(+)